MHKQTNLTRRGFIQHAAAGSAALTWLGSGQGPNLFAAETARPALLGGKPAHAGGWPAWPTWRESWEPAVLEVLRSRRWFRGSGQTVAEFEEAYAKLMGAKRCLATASGTTALLVSLHVMDVDAGDEVIVSPYTFIATYNAVLINKALPVFADTDPATLTMDPASIESRITDRTRAILPVHIFGLPCDMDPINAIAKRHQLAVVEDACQAWLAEYHGRKCGTLGDLGCFSFQESKHLPSGEGGAVTGNSDALMDRCTAFHNCGRATGGFKGERPYFTRGSNYRMQHFQAAILTQQLDKLVSDTARRRANADYLSAQLRQIPGVQPVRLPADSRAVWHLYPFRYDSREFSGLSRDHFMRALGAEGVPVSSVYHEQYFDGLMDEAIESRGFKRLFSPQRLKAYRDSFQELKGNRQACAATVAMTQNMLLAERSDMDHIVEAIRKIRAHSAALAKA
ncbi:MAG TPA: DegT/DnrJ/EryC1/StrS family aminotransferase [Candidatus Paceibacterota bacterium]|nr:DegT/DnrJ/EryC1/StrS family aminotransferase [Verrucomicrobiota bacterium]HOX03455.1 DegT/DnrJ/EryC1/StrS family aminotransferase [Verrucomicrobiota bacterium]HRZ47187.1 DegT/DnrJ/EryC1/StrS family aminotransferase [Candidatus Paceibacterota bacterium]